MQYPLNGFRVGAPSVAMAGTSDMAGSDEVDVVIVGCGPAGLALAARLAVIGGMSVRIFQHKGGPLEVGQADGIASRSMGMPEAFGFAEKVIRETLSYDFPRLLCDKGAAAWHGIYAGQRRGSDRGKPGAGLARADRVQDVEDDLSHMPHCILNRARVHDFYAEYMRNSTLRLEPDYNRRLVGLTRNDAEDYPLEVILDCLDRMGE